MRAANDQNLFRRTIGAEIDRLIAILDDIEGDCDLEDGGDAEPSLGWPERGPAALAKDAAHDDREMEDENDEDGSDREPNGDEADTSFSEDGHP